MYSLFLKYVHAHVLSPNVSILGLIVVVTIYDIFSDLHGFVLRN
jgi:hypothetical protein